MEGILIVAAYSVSGMPSLQARTIPLHFDLGAGYIPAQDVYQVTLHTSLPCYRSAEMIYAERAGALHFWSTLHAAALQLMHQR